MTGDKLRQTVEQLFDVMPGKSDSTELAFLCPQPGCTDKSGHRSVNLKTGLTNCWICNVGGDFVNWARRLGYAISRDDEKVFMALDEISTHVDRTPLDNLPVVASVDLPKGFHLCSDYPRSVYTEFIAEMAERKNLTIEDLFEAKVGFTKTDPRWEPYAIFPTFEYGKVVYYQGRTYDDVPGETTKRFPSRKDVPYSQKYWVYGIDEVRDRKPRTVIAVESILNVLTMRKFIRQHRIKGVEPVCVFQHTVSGPQSKKLRSLDFLEEVVLLFDRDATRRSWDKSANLGNHLRLSVAEMPPGPGGGKNDPNDDPEGAWNAFESRKEADVLSSLDAAFQDVKSPIERFSFTRRPCS